MTDGACGISPELMQEVDEKYCESCSIKERGRNHSAAVIRVMGLVKGVAYVDPRLTGRCLELRDSMKKGQWQQKLSASQQTIRVCSFAKDSGPATINLQILTLMQACMPMSATKKLFEKRFVEQLREDAAVLTTTKFKVLEKFCMDTACSALEKKKAGFSIDHPMIQALLRSALSHKLRTA